ncbi:MAG TPA: cytochrome c [Hyphomicrobiaceae bacterium]|nr:cytochrome c [Hyphomicrobiaceae bacterium]
MTWTTRMISIFATALTLIIITGAPVLNAVAQESGDARHNIVLDPTERAFVLAEMRGFLQSVEGVIGALASDRAAEAKTAAAKSGMAVMHSVPPTLPKKLPKEFMMMGRATHQAFDALAQEAASMGDKTAMLKQLETILNTCNTCHASYRLSGQ